MQLSKSKILPYTGILTLIIFLAMSYFNGSIFIDRLLVCGLILLVVFLLRIASTPKQSASNSEKRGI